MEFRVTNGSANTLTGLRVQMCVMLAGLRGFDKLTNENKLFATPFAACKDETGKRWIITGWGALRSSLGRCDNLSVFALGPSSRRLSTRGETRSVRGWLSFYEGTDIHAELSRLKTATFK